MEVPKVNVLEEARKAIENRRLSYGPPSENHKRTAELWSAYLGVHIDARHVCMMNILQKVSRDGFEPTLDNLIDIAGYAENANQVS